MARPADYARMLNSMRAFFRLAGQGSEGGRAVDLDGVLAGVSPAIPDRSLPNSVIYASQHALIDALPELERLYDEAGVRAWTVWAPEDDEDAIAALEAAGHALDADPAAMWVELASLPAAPELEYRKGDLMHEVGPLNDRAYGVSGEPFTKMTTHWPAGVSHDYVADVAGEPASAVVILDVDSDASVWCVATSPEARSRGLTTRLLHHALIDARERGCNISTLQATKLGEPVYARLGYQSHGAIQMWEKRR
jgi:GNAT superfamily N-acetyltransferase